MKRTTRIKVNHNGRPHVLDAEAAIEAGVLREDTFTLTLDNNEAAVLAFILGRIGGTPAGPRGYATSISHKLSEACDGNSPICDQPIVVDRVNSTIGNLYIEPK